MKRFLLMALFVFSIPAYAADDEYTIKIIHEDGSVDVIDLRQSEPQSVPAPPPAGNKLPPPAEPAVQTPPRAPVAKRPPPSPEPAAIPLPAPRRVEELRPEVAVLKQPDPMVSYGVPIPGRKPHFDPGSVVGAAPSAQPAEPEVPIGPVLINRQQALSIALDHAPPSSDVEVFRSQFKDEVVYAVVFETEEGFYEVLVHPESGEVLDSRKSEHFKPGVRPGHLPSALR